MKMRGVILTSLSFALTSAVVVNAWIQKKQFYPTVVYLTKSSPCLAVLYLQAFVLVLLFGKLVRKIFFGQLRPAETEHLIERSWYAVTDTCLAFTMFRDDFSPLFVTSFTLLLFLKCFHWLLEDRVDYMERSPVITFLFKMRVMSLLALLLMCDFLFVYFSYQSTMTRGASVQLVFGFEYAILAVIILTVFFKYLLHLIDLQSENPWENKAVYMLYIELVTGFLRVLLYILFTAIMVKVHTFPLFCVRPMYLTMRQFKKAVSDIVLSRRAIENMNTLYPDATAEELESADSTCIICREEMQAVDRLQPNERNLQGVNKKLPCGHIFHASCLRSWFQRQQTCPTCRLDVLQAPQPQPQRNNANQAVPQPQQPGAPHIGPNPFGAMFPPMFPPHMLPMGGARPPPPPPSSSQHATTSTTTASSSTAPPPFLMSPPPFMAGPPPPIPPLDLSAMTEDQVRAMEGHERRAVEARVECLRNIRLMLDASMHHIEQYVTVCRRQGDEGLRIAAMEPVSATAPAASEDHAKPEAEVIAEGGDAGEVVASSSDNRSFTTIDDTPSSSTMATTSFTDIQDDDNADGDATPADANELRRRRLAKLANAPTATEQAAAATASTSQ